MSSRAGAPQSFWQGLLRAVNNGRDALHLLSLSVVDGPLMLLVNLLNVWKNRKTISG